MLLGLSVRLDTLLHLLSFYLQLLVLGKVVKHVAFNLCTIDSLSHIKLGRYNAGGNKKRDILLWMLVMMVMMLVGF